VDGLNGLPAENPTDIRPSVLVSLPYYFSVFVAYPIVLEITLSFLYKPIVGSAQLNLRNFSKVFNDPVYIRALYNTLLYVGIAVNFKMFFAFLVSSMLTLKHKGIKIFNVLYLLPWTLPMVPAVVTVN